MDNATFGAIVLAGGQSKRFGRDKASELLLGRPLLAHVVDRVASLVGEITVVRAPEQVLPPIERSVRIVEDAYPGSGPLGGIYSGLAAATPDRCLVVACDMPLLSPALIAELLRRSTAFDVVMPVLKYPEPLHAVYARTCIEPIRARLDAGQGKITSFLGAVHVEYMREDECRAFDSDLHSFRNANTPEDLDEIRRIIERAN